jgi:hypothetical protein
MQEAIKQRFIMNSTTGVYLFLSNTHFNNKYFTALTKQIFYKLKHIHTINFK